LSSGSGSIPLFRPVGPEELELIRQSEFLIWQSDFRPGGLQ
jgi:hypothetical protein